MKRFVDVPRDLTALRAEILSRVAGHPFHPYVFLWHSMLPTQPDLPLACYSSVTFCMCPRCVATELFKRHSVMVWSERMNHFVNLQFCKLCLKGLSWWNRFYFATVVFGIIENLSRLALGSTMPTKWIYWWRGRRFRERFYLNIDFSRLLAHQCMMYWTLIIHGYSIFRTTNVTKIHVLHY